MRGLRGRKPVHFMQWTLQRCFQNVSIVKNIGMAKLLRYMYDRLISVYWIWNCVQPMWAIDLGLLYEAAYCIHNRPGIQPLQLNFRSANTILRGNCRIAFIATVGHTCTWLYSLECMATCSWYWSHVHLHVVQRTRLSTIGGRAFPVDAQFPGAVKHCHRTPRRHRHWLFLGNTSRLQSSVFSRSFPLLTVQAVASAQWLRNFARSC